MDAFFGSWEHVKSDNFKNYLLALGISDKQIGVAKIFKPTLTFSQDGESIGIKSMNDIFTKEDWFKLGEEFSEETKDGRQCKNVITLEGDKLVQVQSWDENHTTIVREIIGDELITTMTFGDSVATFTYKKI